MAKILYITTTYILKNSSAAIRNNSVVKGFIQLGHDVDVYTLEWSPNLFSPFFKTENNGNINYSTLSNLNKIASIKKKVKKNHPFLSKSKQILKKILFFPDECSEWIKIFDYNKIPFDKYDFFITSSDHKTSHFIGYKIKQKHNNLQWIQIWGDPWSSDLSTLRFMKGITAHYEKKMITAADNVIYVSAITANEMKKKHPKLSHKIHFIPRSYYPTKIEYVNDNSQTDKIKIVYTGLISSGRNIFHLLNVLETNNCYNKNIQIDIYGNLSYEIKEKLKGYSFVNIFDGIDFEHMNSIYESASILLFLSNKGGASQIPGKFFDYMGTTKPILCLMEDDKDEVSSFLRNYDRCLVIKNTIDSIKFNLEEIFKLSEKKFDKDEEFSPKTIAAKILKYLRINHSEQCAR